MGVHCDFCEAPAVLSVESIDGDRAYLCGEHRTLAAEAGPDWFEPEAIAADVDPRSGLPLIV